MQTFARLYIKVKDCRTFVKIYKVLATYLVSLANIMYLCLNLASLDAKYNKH